LRTLQQTLAAFQDAQSQRQRRESRFDQCFKYAMPGRASYFSDDPVDQMDDVFDETAIVATQEFASRLQAGITPNFSRWATLKAGSAIPPDQRDQLVAPLQKLTQYCFEVLDQSNFATESYEAYLDLSVSLGCFEIEKGTVLEPIRFHAVPIAELWIRNGPFDRIDEFYRLRSYTYEQLIVKYPDFTMSADQKVEFEKCGKPYKFLEATWRDWHQPNDFLWHRHVILMEGSGGQEIVQKIEYRGAGACPMIAFRWSKESGSVWGRGPLMNALPAIKTTNLTIQMILENGQMAIAGMYNMDDDATVNVDTIELVPGTIIPRTPGNRGLEPIAPAGKFDVADLILNDMRANIKRALYNDMLGNPDRTPMSATEVAERMADLARQIGAAFGRLMFEMVIPTLQRVFWILKEMKLVQAPVINGAEIAISATSPLAQAQNQMDIQSIDRLCEWIGARFGPQMVGILIKAPQAAAYVGDKLQAPKDLIRSEEEIKQGAEGMAQAMPQLQGMMQGQAPAAAEGAPVV